MAEIGCWRRKGKAWKTSAAPNVRRSSRFPHSPKEATEIRCYWCKQLIPKGKRKRHIDHIIPLNKKGPHVAWNLCCACAKCNAKKGAKDPGDFSGQKELLLMPTEKKK